VSDPLEVVRRLMGVVYAVGAFVLAIGLAWIIGGTDGES
jgi:hypothetical protein